MMDEEVAISGPNRYYTQRVILQTGELDEHKTLIISLLGQGVDEDEEKLEEFHFMMLQREFDELIETYQNRKEED